MKKYNYNIDRGRFLAAFLVVLIHVTASLPEAVRASSRVYQFAGSLFNVGVPFFFTISGYLLVGRSRDYQMKYVKRIFRLHIVASVIYIVFDLVLLSLASITEGSSFVDLLQVWWSEKSWMSLLNGTWGQFHLWYLFALAIGVFLIVLGRRCGLNRKAIFSVSFILFIFTSYMSQSNETMAGILRYGGFLKAMTYLSVGALVRAKEVPFLFSQASLGRSVLLLLIYAAFYLWKGPFLIEESLMVITMTAFARWLHHNPGQENMFSRLGQFSDGIYIFHIFWIRLVDIFLAPFPAFYYDFPGSYVLLTSVICVLGSIFLYKPFNKYVSPVLEAG